MMVTLFSFATWIWTNADRPKFAFIFIKLINNHISFQGAAGGRSTDASVPRQIGLRNPNLGSTW